MLVVEDRLPSLLDAAGAAAIANPNVQVTGNHRSGVGAAEAPRLPAHETHSLERRTCAPLLPTDGSIYLSRPGSIYLSAIAHSTDQGEFPL